jgi:predicted transport protein
MKLFTNNKTYHEFQFDKESDFEREVVINSKQFFGLNSIYVDAKRKIETKNLGNSIPDGFLFDLTDKENPEFYIVEVELAKHDFYNHIFPQITKFFGFYKNPKNQNDLIEKIFTFINSDNDLKKEFKKYLGEKEIYKFVKDTIENSQNILLIIDADKKELPEIMETYTDTWGKMVKLILIKKFSQNGETIYSMHPDFENIEFAEIETIVSMETEEVEYNEEYHLDGVSESVRQIYNELKTELLKESPNLIFNPQKFYISIRKDRSIAFFLISRKKIRLVVMQSDEETRKEIIHYSVKTLSAGVQKFWNGPSCAIIIDKEENLNEVKELLNKLVKRY